MTAISDAHAMQKAPSKALASEEIRIYTASVAGSILAAIPSRSSITTIVSYNPSLALKHISHSFHTLQFLVSFLLFS